MKRSTFLWLSFATTASLGLPVVSCKSRDTALQKTLAQPQLLSHICDEKTLKEIGKAYRQKQPAEDNANKLQDLLTRNYPNQQPEQWHARLEQQIKKDFETADMVVVQGWILSTTEARQCALFSLL